jgi:hypothetical protein
VAAIVAAANAKRIHASAANMRTMSRAASKNHAAITIITAAVVANRLTRVNNAFHF